jgi:tRNA (adenine37-N6)-methyltransferase
MPAFDYIGKVYSEFKTIENMPIQGAGISKINGYIEVLDKYVDGLRDLEGFSHCYVIFHLHKVNGYSLHVKPFLDNKLRGVFATRSPKRPNAIGLSIVKIDSIEYNRVNLNEIDILDGTPVLDIKPYITSFDEITSEKNGWYEKAMDPVAILSDGRFK